MAYRYATDVEGFVGVGFTEKAAKQDALNQLVKKLEIVEPIWPAHRRMFDSRQLICTEQEAKAALTPQELKIVQCDWASGFRY
jgi:hypothetical protein